MRSLDPIKAVNPVRAVIDSKLVPGTEAVRHNAILPCDYQKRWITAMYHADMMTAQRDIRFGKCRRLIAGNP